jgi:uncharacterized membrane protein
MVLGYALLAGLPVASRIVAACNLGGWVFLALTWPMLVHATPSHMRVRSQQFDEGKWAFLTLTVGVAFFALFATIFEMRDVEDQDRLGLAVHLGLVVTTILCSWLVMHTSFALHYAHAYYGRAADGSDTGGLNFPGDVPPDYWDFLYFSLVVGMTSQVSDVTISRPHLRRLTLAHSVLSFFFNTVILAMTINMVAGMGT